MAKQGILNDYDLQANQENSARNQTCHICGTENMAFQWSDCSGEAMCTKCGCPYQLKWGDEMQEKEGKYPYLNLKAGFIPIAKEYWDKTHKFVCYGYMLWHQPGLNELVDWAKENYPEGKIKEISKEYQVELRRIYPKLEG